MSGAVNDSQHWSRQKEIGSSVSVKFLFFLFKIFPVWLLRCLAFPVGFFYYIFSGKARIESKRFLDNVACFIDEKDLKLRKRIKNKFASLRHIISFALSLLDKIQSWSGRYNFNSIHFQDDDIGELIKELEEGRGVFLVISHLGNAEALRALLNQGKTGISRKISFTAVMDVNVSGNFTGMLKKINPESGMDIMGADEIGPASAFIFEEKIASGGMVLVAGDRTSAQSGGKNIVLPFLGKSAPFSLGMFYIASLLNAPIYFIFGMRRKELSIKSEYDMYVHKNNISFKGTRKERMEQTVSLAASFADFLEKYCKKYPFQWYNFFNFWRNGEEA